MRDAVIVGGGLAGLTAAWRLRFWDIELLEESPRIGGRIRSETRGRYFMNWGGHVFAGAGSSTDTLLRETGTRTVEVPGALSGLAMNGRLITSGWIPTYPFRIPMPGSSRAALLRAGARISLDVLRYARASRLRPGETGATRQQRIYDFENDRSFADYIGELPEDAEALFRPTVSRSAGDPDELSAGAGIGYFNLVWNIGQGLNRSILGGPSTLTETLAAALGDRVQTRTRVEEVVQHPDHVVVRFTRDGVSQQVRARTVVLATPAPVSHRIGVDLPEDVRDALSKVAYGSYVSAAFLTGETTRKPWDDTYGIATPKRSFSVALNMGNVVHGLSRERHPGGSLMTFSPAGLARQLIGRTDEEITATYLRDLDGFLPGFSEDVVEARVQRWELGAPYCFPGRGALQPVLTRAGSRIHLAGDYLGTLYTETAIESAYTAAQAIRSTLASERQVAAVADRRSVAEHV